MHLSQCQAHTQHSIDARHDYIAVTMSLLFSGCPLPTRKVRRGPLYLDIRLLPALSLNFLLSELNTPEMLKIIQVLKSPVSSLTLKAWEMCSLALEYSIILSCSTTWHAPPTSALIWVSLCRASQSTHSTIFTHSVPVSSMCLSSMSSGAMFCSSCYNYTPAAFLFHNRQYLLHAWLKL